jgi:proteasome lid subunit RPN8/RPN11
MVVQEQGPGAGWEVTESSMTILSRSSVSGGTRSSSAITFRALGVRVGAGLRAELVEWSLASAPREACGFLFGIARSDRFEVRTATCARNIADGDDAFLLDPGDVVRADLFAREQGLELVGFWHSHPRAPAIPSCPDEIAAWPGYLCVIQSLGEPPALRAWRCVEGRFQEARVET